MTVPQAPEYIIILAEKIGDWQVIKKGNQNCYEDGPTIKQHRVNASCLLVAGYWRVSITVSIVRGIGDYHVITSYVDYAKTT